MFSVVLVSEKRLNLCAALNPRDPFRLLRPGFPGSVFQFEEKQGRGFHEHEIWESFRRVSQVLAALPGVRNEPALRLGEVRQSALERGLVCRFVQVLHGVNDFEGCQNGTFARSVVRSERPDGGWTATGPNRFKAAQDVT